MAQHAGKSSHLQLVDRLETVAVQVRLPVLGALAHAENAFFELCVEVGQQDSSLEAEHPGAAGSIREGLDETLTLQRLGIEGALYRTLRSTNTIENLNGGVATYTRNVKRWRGGSMIVRWVSAAVLEAQGRFRRIRGYKEIHRLIAALLGAQGRHAGPNSQNCGVSRHPCR